MINRDQTPEPEDRIVRTWNNGRGPRVSIMLGASEHVVDVKRAIALRDALIEALAAMDTDQWTCPADSSECEIRKRCTNKCGQLVAQPSTAATSRYNHDGSPGWRAGIEASLRNVRWRQSIMSDLQVPGYRAALAELVVFLEAMLARGTERSTCTLDGLAPTQDEGTPR